MEIIYSEVKNPRWANQEHTHIICEVNFEHETEEEFCLFVAVASGDLPHTHQIFAECVAGKWGQIAEYVPYVPTTEEMNQHARSQRDALLAQTDWTQAADVPQATKDKWAPYRQALRDVPQQAGFPTNVTWPTKPE